MQVKCKFKAEGCVVLGHIATLTQVSTVRSFVVVRICQPISLPAVNVMSRLNICSHRKHMQKILQFDHSAEACRVCLVRRSDHARLDPSSFTKYESLLYCKRKILAQGEDWDWGYLVTKKIAKKYIICSTMPSAYLYIVAISLVASWQALCCCWRLPDVEL